MAEIKIDGKTPKEIKIGGKTVLQLEFGGKKIDYIGGIDVGGMVIKDTDYSGINAQVASSGIIELIGLTPNETIRRVKTLILTFKTDVIAKSDSKGALIFVPNLTEEGIKKSTSVIVQPSTEYIFKFGKTYILSADGVKEI